VSHFSSKATGPSRSLAAGPSRRKLAVTNSCCVGSRRWSRRSPPRSRRR
jgi:hypothetical protein